MIDGINHMDFLGEWPIEVRNFNSFRITSREIIPTTILHDHRTMLFRKFDHVLQFQFTIITSFIGLKVLVHCIAN
jgi:hypothetical protein